MPPAPPVAALAARVLAVEPGQVSWTCLKGQPTEHAVWRADGPAAAIVLKAHRRGRSFPQELRAYQDWLPRLPARERHAPSAPPSPRERHDGSGAPRSIAESGAPRPAFATPTLRGVDLADRILALSLAPGARLSSGTHDPATERGLAPPPAPRARLSSGTHDLDAERTAHAAAGRFARALHDLPAADDDPVPLLDAVRARLARALDQAAPLLTPAERAALATHTAKLDAFAGAARTPCHRDFTPDNWLSSGTGSLTVLDFEHARLDAPEVDLVKLRAEVWLGRPDLAAAFLAGHGALTTDQAARLDVLLALHAAATLAWADRHVDATFRARGRQALAAALASA